MSVTTDHYNKDTCNNLEYSIEYNGVQGLAIQTSV